MNNSDFKDRRQYEFAKLLMSSCKGYRDTYTVFQDFLELSTIGVQHANYQVRHRKLNHELKNASNKIWEAYEKPQAFADCLELLGDAMEDNGPHDFLGNVYQGLSINNKKFGQFFTPDPVSLMCSKIILGDTKPNEKRILINEPAVGGGAMILSTQKTLLDNGHKPWNYYVVAQDISPMCVKMSLLQFNVCCIPAVVILGNTIALEVKEVYETLHSVLFPYNPERQTNIESEPQAERELAKEEHGTKNIKIEEVC